MDNTVSIEQHDFHVTIKNFVFGMNRDEYGDTDQIRAVVPSGWHPILEAFFADLDVTEMSVTSTNIGVHITFRHQPGAVASPPKAKDL